MDTRFAFPWRAEGNITTLITAEDGYPAFERLVAGAQQDVPLAFRIFDPTTRLRHLTHLGETWSDLFADRLSAGVHVRIVLADFDPIGAPSLHEGTWRAASALEDLRGLGSLDVMPVRHSAVAGTGLQVGFWPVAVLTIDRQRRELNDLDGDERLRIFATRPGLWRYLRLWTDNRLVWRTPTMPRLYPVTHHQKFVVADDAKVIVGGLDIDERRYDDKRHQRPSEETWHDVSLECDGPIAADFGKHFADVWNVNRRAMVKLRQEQAAVAPPGAIRLPPPPAAMAEPDPKLDEAPGTSRLRLVRTLSSPQRHASFSLSPRTRCRELEAAHLDLFRRAERLIYIETQFFHSSQISEGLAEVGRQTRDLGLVLVLPAAPEDVAFEDAQGLAARFGEARQADCISAVSSAFGGRATIVSPVRPVMRHSDGRDTAYGSEIVYVHSKVCVVDDRAAIVSSANLNGRSMRWDTEAGVVWESSSEVADFRRRLCAKWLPDDAPPSWNDMAEVQKAWRRVAEANVTRPPERRQGFLVPYDLAIAGEFGMDVPGLTEDLV